SKAAPPSRACVAGNSRAISRCMRSAYMRRYTATDSRGSLPSISAIASRACLERALPPVASARRPRWSSASSAGGPGGKGSSRVESVADRRRLLDLCVEHGERRYRRVPLHHRGHETEPFDGTREQIPHGLCDRRRVCVDEAPAYARVAREMDLRHAVYGQRREIVRRIAPSVGGAHVDV